MLESLIGSLLAIIFILILLSSLLFVFAVTYLNQWDRYYPPLHRYLQARKAAKHKEAQNKRKHEAKLIRRNHGRD